MWYQQQISDINFEMLKRQYETIQKVYTEKRMLLHDSVHQDVLILEYLQNGKLNIEKHRHILKRRSQQLKRRVKTDIQG